MRKLQLNTSFTVFENLEELPETVQHLFTLACEARTDAYAPYSKFHVGAAILLENGEIVKGSNQENASYPSGLCAERVAIYHAGAMFPKVNIKTIVITVASQNYTVDRPAAPCGACRQAIAEYEQKQEGNIEIYFRGETGEIIKTDAISDLLPLGFDSSFL
jgi:cytidine deaminase